MGNKYIERHDPWYWTTAHGAEMHSLLTGFDSSFREKIQWLEEAETLSLIFEENRAKAKEDVKQPSDQST